MTKLNSITINIPTTVSVDDWIMTKNGFSGYVTEIQEVMAPEPEAKEPDAYRFKVFYKSDATGRIGWAYGHAITKARSTRR